MSRLVLLVILVLVVGGLVFLSTIPRQRSTHTIEAAVPPAGNAH